jgi:hypothetical protein
VTSTIYVRLLGEGTEVFRPVPARLLPGSKGVLEGQEIFDSDAEDWEFPPGSIVHVEERILSGERVLVAARMA